MAKKAAPKKVAPKSKAKVETKVEAKVAAPKKHERVAKPSEAELLERGRRLVIGLFVNRDGMDEETAKMVVESMAPEDINALIVEANTAVIEGTSASGTAGGSESPTGQAEPAAGGTGESAGGAADYVDYSTFDALEADDKFPELVMKCASLQIIKSKAEKDYKKIKQVLWDKMVAAGVKPDVDRLECAGTLLAPYKGHHVQVNELLLMENGVSADIIVKSRKDTPFNDVRIIPPKEE